LRGSVALLRGVLLLSAGGAGEGVRGHPSTNTLGWAGCTVVRGCALVLLHRETAVVTLHLTEWPARRRLACSRPAVACGGVLEWLHARKGCDEGRFSLSLRVYFLAPRLLLHKLIPPSWVWGWCLW
jgi:hypothetical protein